MSDSISICLTSAQDILRQLQCFHHIFTVGDKGRNQARLIRLRAGEEGLALDISAEMEEQTFPATYYDSTAICHSYPQPYMIDYSDFIHFYSLSASYHFTARARQDTPGICRNHAGGPLPTGDNHTFLQRHFGAWSSHHWLPDIFLV